MIVPFTTGAVFDVAVDLRESSKNFGQWVGLELSADNKKQLWIPAGLAHGFLVMSEEAEFLYKTTDYYHPQSEQSILWNDPTLNIAWPNIGISPLVNAKDAQGLTWQLAPKLD